MFTMGIRLHPGRVFRAAVLIATLLLIAFLILQRWPYFVTFKKLRKNSSHSVLLHHELPTDTFNVIDVLEAAQKASSAQESSPVIPLIHQSWKNRSLPRLFATWSKSFKKHFPSFTHLLWTDEDNMKLIEKHYPWFLPRYLSYKSSVQRADVVRLFYMYKYGGIYCDLDCECVRNFAHLLVNTSLAFGAMAGKMILSPQMSSYVEEGQIENSFMYSRPGHPFFWELIVSLNATVKGQAIMSTGPYLIMTGINSSRKRKLDQTKYKSRSYLTIFPPYYFNPFSWITRNGPPACREFGNFYSPDDPARCRDHFKNAYIVQYHTQVWDKGARWVLR